MGSTPHFPGLLPIIPTLLKAIDDVMSREFSAEIISETGKTNIDMVRLILNWVIVQIQQHDQLYRSRTDAEQKLLDNPFASGLNLRELGYATVAARLGEELGTAIPQIHADEGSAARLLEKLKGLSICEDAYHAALDPESGADISSAYRAGKKLTVDAVEPQRSMLTDSNVTEYLQRRFPDFPQIHACNVQALPGGTGKDTIALDLSGHPMFGGAIVLRKDLPALTFDVSAVAEFALLQALHRAGITVPEPLWAEPDALQLGTRFIAVRRVPGRVATSMHDAGAQERLQFADQLARSMAAIHSMPVPALEHVTRLSRSTVSGCLQAQISDLKEFWHRKRFEPSPALDVAFAWLQHNIPAEPPYAPTLVHGDVGFHNLMIDGGEVSAILDWEFAHIGDPAEDVNYSRQFVDQYVSWKFFLERYLAYGGKAYGEEQDRFFTVWRNVRNAVLSLGALFTAVQSRKGTLKMIIAGLAYNPRFESEALRLIRGYLTKNSQPA